MQIVHSDTKNKNMAQESA